jgi:hypothetical protein
VTADPTTPLNQAATTMHELFTSLMTGGFTERQACQIIAEILRGAE